MRVEGGGVEGLGLGALRHMKPQGGHEGVAI